MPFKSDAQRRYLYAFEPKVAKEFAAKTPEGADLPNKIGDQSKKETMHRRLAAMREMTK